VSNARNSLFALRGSLIGGISRNFIGYVGNNTNMRLKLIPLVFAVAGTLPWMHAATLSQGFQVVPDSLIVRSRLTAPETSAIVHFHVVLQMPQAAALQALIQSKERLSRAQLEAYLPAAADYARVQQWFVNQGFTVTLNDSTHSEVFLQGTVGQIADALQIRFARVTTSDGEATSAVTPPVLPDSVAACVQSVRGLQPFSRRHHPHQVIISSAGLPSVNFTHYADPATIAAYYNAPSGLTGSGETIAIIGDSIPASSDLTAFWTVCGIPQSIGNFTVIPIDGGPGSSTADQDEAALDVEWASGIATGASIRYYATPYPMYDEDAAYVQILNDLGTFPSIHEVSESYGGVEQVGDSIPAFSLLEAQGVTCFASSGDSGSNPTPPWAPAPGYYNATYPLAVCYPASDPGVTGVGGTTVQLNASGQEMAPETAWSLSQTSNRYATGGGLSQLFLRPSWQVGTGVPNGTMRCIPDVAAMAWSTSGTLTPFIIVGNQVVGIGGTSLSCPIWAGFCALINQNRASQGLGSIGALNPQIYPLIGSPSFKDITVGNNGAYSAGIGYDLCTGVGSPSVANLVAALSGTAPQITNQPQATQTVLVGGTASFTVVATGNPAPTYQWSFGSSPINGATAATYTLTNVQAAQAGSYSVKVTNPVGSVTSSPAALVVQQAPSITTQPLASQTVLVGGTASFTVVAAGIPTPTYQWSFGSSPINGATAATYTLTNVQAAQAGSYSVTVTNPVGSVTSSPAALVVQQAPSITTQPLASQTVLVGGTASFTVVATGIPTPTYQWSFGSSPINGATAATYTLTNVQAAQAGSYSVTVTNPVSSVTSSPAALVVQQAPKITTQPVAAESVLVGGTASFSVVATGIPSPTYQWYYGATPILGATAATYSVKITQLAQAGLYKVTVSNPAGSVTSSATGLTVLGAPPIMLLFGR
jgi:subtilase family serine protease